MSEPFGTDLFGYPDRPGRGQRGRPAFVPTLRDRNRVRLLTALGWSLERIANAVECSVPTLRRRFKIELKERAQMRDRLDARLLEIAMDEAAKGNMTALREAQRLIEKNDARVAEASFSAPSPSAEKSDRLGVKAQRKLDAEATEEELMREIEAEADSLVKH